MPGKGKGKVGNGLKAKNSMTFRRGTPEDKVAMEFQFNFFFTMFPYIL